MTIQKMGIKRYISNGFLKKQFNYQDGREASGDRRTVWKGVKLTGRYILEGEQQMLAV